MKPLYIRVISTEKRKSQDGTLNKESSKAEKAKKKNLFAEIGSISAVRHDWLR